MHARRVVITGMGAITPLGHSVESLYKNACAGQSGVGRISRFNASTFPTQIAGEVKGFDLGQYLPNSERWNACGLNTKFALAAAKQALEDADLLPGSGGTVDRTRFGAYLGSGEGVHDFTHLVAAVANSYRTDTRRIDPASFFKLGLRDFNPASEYELEMHTTPAHLAEVFELDGPNFNCLTACAASSQAVGEATAMIRAGDADLMLSGGSHSMIHPLGVSGFNRLTALSVENDAPEKASKPFDLNRSGFVMGEGAGMVVLEELEHAKRRGATIYAEVTGYGTTGDAYRVTDSLPDGRGAAASMSMALRDSGLSVNDIGYINAHGTSTKVNDRGESMAVKAVFGERAYKIPMSSSKSMLGHLIAAAGAVELIILVETMRRGTLPPTINYETPDPECDLDYVPNVARSGNVEHGLSNSFGFGGQNVSLIASRFAG